MSANPDLRPVSEPGPRAAEGAPTPQQVLDLLNRVSAETNDVRDRLLALTHEIDAAAQRLQTLADPRSGVRLTAVAVPAAPETATQTPPDVLASPAMLVAVEMAVAGFSRAEVHARLTNDFAIADPTAILDDVFGADARGDG